MQEETNETEEKHAMEKPLTRLRHIRSAGIILTALVMLLCCGLTALAAEEPMPLPITADDAAEANTELYPADVQTIIGDDGGRLIVRTYVLTQWQKPSDIPRDSFIRDGWRYALTDITERRTISTDSRTHAEKLEIETEGNDLNEIISLLSPAISIQSEDGYAGTLVLDISTVKCEEAGHRTGSYTVTATREYPHLSNADTSLLPKTITDRGRTLTLESVSWETQNYVNVDYANIPDSYRAVALYTANATSRTVTGYVTSAEYAGEISKTSAGDTIYTAYFAGTEINTAPRQAQEPEPEPAAEAGPMPAAAGNGKSRIVPILIAIGILAAFLGAGAYLRLRRNVKVYKDDFRVLVAKDKISAKMKTIDLSPLEGDRFGIEIDRLAAKPMNGHTVEIRHGPASLKHKIAYEGNAYRIDADFGGGTAQAIY